jgi:hypothetical protein
MSKVASSGAVRSVRDTRAEKLSGEGESAVDHGDVVDRHDLGAAALQLECEEAVARTEIECPHPTTVDGDGQHLEHGSRLVRAGRNGSGPYLNGVVPV